MAKYLSLPKSTQKADKRFLRDVILATEEVFKGDLFGEVNRPLSEPYTTPDGNYHWSSGKELLTYVTDLTGTEDIKSANAALYSDLSSVPENSEATMTGAPEYAVSSNTLTPDQLKEMQRNLKEKEEFTAGIAAKTKEGLEKEIKQREIYAKVRIKKAELAEEEQKAAEVMVEQIKSAPVKEAINTVKQQIQSRVPEEISEDDIEITAGFIVANVKNNFAPAAQPAVIETAAKKPGLDLADQSKTLAEQKDLIKRSQGVTELAFGKPLQEFLIPDVTVEDISDVSSSGFTPMQIPVIYTQTPRAGETETVAFGRSWVDVQLSQIKGGGIQGTNYNPKAFQGSFSAFKPIVGFAKDAALNKVRGLATKAVVGAVATAGAPETLGLSFAAAKLAGPILDLFSKIQRTFKENPALPVMIGGAMFLPLILFGPSVLAIGAAILGAGIGATGIASGATLGGVAGRLGAVGSTVAAALVPTIGVPVIVTLISFPVVVALILFIINSGAYIVPVAPKITTAVTSPYIDVIKTPVPPGPFTNANLPLTVEYKIEIKAKKGPLQNVRISYNCSVIKKAASTVCPKTDIPIPGGVEGGVSPTGSFTFSYKQTYDSLNYQDSFITDTITVTADAIEQKNAEAATSATIKIGNPPEDCPSIWPTSKGHISQGAYTGKPSHIGIEALDIGVSGVNVMATHTGVVVSAQTDSCYGNNIKIKSNCNGKEFISRYAHLEGMSVKTGQTVTMGQRIGKSGNTTGGKSSCSTGPHLHYEFKYPSGNPKWPSNPPFMMKPYVPNDVPRGCNSTGQCGVSW